MKAAPVVAVGLPTYNRASSLRETIESVLAQDYTNFELVISDNASSDDTQRLCEEYSAKDERIRYIRQPNNRGMIANYHEVLHRSSAKYFMWMADDDQLEHSYLSRCLEALRADVGISLVCGKAEYYDGDALVFEGAIVNVREPSPSARVLSFYGQVSDNGTFYGLAHRARLLADPLRDIFAGDWLLLAALALTGEIRTIESVAIKRSSRGASADLYSLALSFGSKVSEAKRPYQTIAGIVFGDITRDSPSFSKLGLVARWALACRCLYVLYGRFVINENPIAIWSNRIRFRLKLRTRLKRALRIS